MFAFTALCLTTSAAFFGLGGANVSRIIDSDSLARLLTYYCPHSAYPRYSRNCADHWKLRPDWPRLTAAPPAHISKLYRRVCQDGRAGTCLLSLRWACPKSWLFPLSCAELLLQLGRQRYFRWFGNRCSGQCRSHRVRNIVSHPFDVMNGPSETLRLLLLANKVCRCYHTGLARPFSL
jgi:hypothetical protein